MAARRRSAALKIQVNREIRSIHASVPEPSLQLLMPSGLDACRSRASAPLGLAAVTQIHLCCAASFAQLGEECLR
jgi:hypothetical protein